MSDVWRDFRREPLSRPGLFYAVVAALLIATGAILYVDWRLHGLHLRWLLGCTRAKIGKRGSAPEIAGVCSAVNEARFFYGCCQNALSAN